MNSSISGVRLPPRPSARSTSSISLTSANSSATKNPPTSIPTTTSSPSRRCNQAERRQRLGGRVVPRPLRHRVQKARRRPRQGVHPTAAILQTNSNWACSIRVQNNDRAGQRKCVARKHNDHAGQRNNRARQRKFSARQGNNRARQRKISCLSVQAGAHQRPSGVAERRTEAMW